MAHRLAPLAHGSMAMIEDKTTEERPTNLDETFKAAAAPVVADPSTPDNPAVEPIELDDEQAQAISGGFVFQKIVVTG